MKNNGLGPFANDLSHSPREEFLMSRLHFGTKNLTLLFLHARTAKQAPTTPRRCRMRRKLTSYLPSLSTPKFCDFSRNRTRFSLECSHPSAFFKASTQFMRGQCFYSTSHDRRELSICGFLEFKAKPESGSSTPLINGETALSFYTPQEGSQQPASKPIIIQMETGL